MFSRDAAPGECSGAFTTGCSIMSRQETFSSRWGLIVAGLGMAIGTGNMTPAGTRMVCVDISPAVVTKLADRGSVESTGIVTDVGLFLNLLAQQLRS